MRNCMASSFTTYLNSLNHVVGLLLSVLFRLWKVISIIQSCTFCYMILQSCRASQSLRSDVCISGVLIVPLVYFGNKLHQTQIIYCDMFMSRKLFNDKMRYFLTLNSSSHIKHPFHYNYHIDVSYLSHTLEVPHYTWHLH